MKNVARSSYRTVLYCIISVALVAVAAMAIITTHERAGFKAQDVPSNADTSSVGVTSEPLASPNEYRSGTGGVNAGNDLRSKPETLADVLITQKPRLDEKMVAKVDIRPASSAAAGVRTRKELKPVQDDDEDGPGEKVVVARNGLTIEKESLERTDEPGEAIQYYLDQRLPPGEKELPVERYFKAREEMKAMGRFSTGKNLVLPPEDRTSKQASDAQQSFSWNTLGPGNVGGRTRALLIDPSNPNTMYAAGVAGGIWKTTDGGASWNALNDFMANIAVTCLTFKPGDPNTIYAGTGEGFFNADGVRGAGIFKSTNAGLSWSRLAATANNSDFFYITDIVVGNGANDQHVYASTRTGVWRSLDGGGSWTQAIASNAANGANGAMDLAIRTDQATDYVFAAVGTFSQSHIFRNTDAGGAGTWVDVYSEAGMGRTSLAIAPSNQSVVYAMSASIVAGSYSDGLLAVFRSAANGDSGSWTAQVRNTSANKQDTLLLSNPVYGALSQCGFGSTQFLNQGWYDNQLAVDPTDPNVVWAAGIDTWRSDNAGVNWGVASYWWFQGTGINPAGNDVNTVHADNHVIVFHPGYNGTSNQTMLVGNDGGIFRTLNAKTGNVGYVGGTTPAGGTITAASPLCGNPVANSVTWAAINNNYQVTQFYDGAVYPNGTTYFGGTQDNGTNRGTDSAGSGSWERIMGGDGGYVAVDPGNTNILYGEFTGLSIQKSTNGGVSFSNAFSGISGDAFPFITVFQMDPSTPSRLWIGGRFLWRTDNSAGSWTRTSATGQTGGSITAIAIAPTNSNIVINGAASGQLRRTTIATTANAASVLNTVWIQSFTPRGNGNGTISWLAYDPTNANNVWATISNFNGIANVNGTSAGHVFKSADGGATWTLADGSQTPGNVNAIPDIPAHSVLVDPTNNQRIYVGTDLGVFVSLDGGANWLQEAGFPNVPVESLSLNKVAPTTKLYAFTHGRGAFSTVVAVDTADLAINKSLVTAGPYSPGQQITYSLVVSNAGPATATNIQVTDTPTNLTITNVTGSGCAALPCTIASLAANSNTTITVTAQIVATGAFDNSASVVATEFDPNTADNTDNTGNGGFARLPVLAVTKTHSLPFVQGRETAWTIQVKNNGATAADSTTGTTTVVDTLPSGYSMLSYTGTNWNCTGTTTVTCTSSDVIAGGGTFPLITINVVAPPTSPISISNTANAFGGGDPVHTSLATAASGTDNVTVTQVAATLAIVAGNNQSTQVNTPFGTNLSVIAKDAANVVISGGSVVFNAPLTGPSGAFPDLSRSIAANTNASGIATAPTLKANNLAGGPYFVTASIDALTVKFSLTNLPGPGSGYPRADFDGDGRTDLSVFRPSEGNWYINGSATGFTGVHWGISTDRIIPGDFDGDGKADLAVWRPTDSEGVADFYILNSNGNVVSGYAWGSPGDIPMTGDYNGDGMTDITVFRPSTSEWWIWTPQTQTVQTFLFGSSGDVPMVMDFNGDGKTDLAVYRSGDRTWYMANASGVPAQTFSAVQFGDPGDILVPADYDGDNKDDVAVFRPSNGNWYILRSSDSGLTQMQFGLGTDIPVPGDYDGDGKDDMAVYRPSNGAWYLNMSTAGFAVQAFGMSTDIPVPAAYHP